MFSVFFEYNCKSILNGILISISKSSRIDGFYSFIDAIIWLYAKMKNCGLAIAFTVTIGDCVENMILELTFMSIVIVKK